MTGIYNNRNYLKFGILDLPPRHLRIDCAVLAIDLHCWQVAIEGWI